MKKRMMAVGMWILAAMVCAGCSGSHPQQPGDSAESITAVLYSNLVDASAQQEVAALLESHGISQAQTDTLVAWADDFNERVTSEPLPEGFQTMEGDGTGYPGLIIENKEGPEGQIEPEANCRLTSFLLMKHFIETNGKHEENDSFLMFDLEAIDTYAPFRLSEEERSKFVSLFSCVPMDGARTVEEHAKRIQAAWKEREIRVDAKGLSLITVYVHFPPEDMRFVGHTGVLLETEDGLLFVEKYGPQFPFQATRFHDREELKAYLLGRADLYGDETELAPIVMENEQVLS